VPALALAASAVPAGPVAALVALGAVVALGGHLAGSRRTVVAGLAILFVASALMIVGGYLAYRDDPGDPRPCAQPGTC
jgi:ABC-type Na+ efflux pump permease subunit